MTMAESDDLLEALRKLNTAVVSDTCDRLGVITQAAGIKRVAGSGTIAGRAFTVQYVPCGTEGGTVGDYVDDVEPGSVIVLSNHGRTDVTVWGGILSEVAEHRGISATVIDGICRDTQRAHDVDYSLYARDHWMRTGKDRVRAEAYNIAVALGGCLVRPDDVIVGDADGILVLPRERAEEITTLATEIEATEAAISEEAVKNNVRLSDARAKHGYHNLQTRR
jgi:4-hydroxy-4-methyl-2-oxoglutarate aldolase